MEAREKKYFYNLLENKKVYYYLFILLLIAQRFFHFKSAIDEPHAWRQFDTLYYAYDFYKNGFNILKPSVCWLGGYKTLILEFPLISYLIAVFYYIFTPSIFFARLVPLLFYLGSAYYLFAIVKFLYYPRLAKLTLLIYLMLPLSLFYSRAIHIDFGALCFSLGMIYYYLLGFNKDKLSYIILGSACSLFAFLIKAPYPFYLFIPLMYCVYVNKKFRFFIKTLAIIILPIVLFIIWENYSIKLNGSAPNWFFIPDYFKFDKMSEWYFGYIQQRLDPENWKNIFYKFVESTTSYIGIIFFATGLFLPLDKNYKKTFFYFYLIGIVVYLIIFFNLILIHEYYQIPILVVSSFFIAVSLDHIFRKIKERSSSMANIFIGLLIIVLTINCVMFTNRWYYNVDSLRLEASYIIKTNTNEDALVIVSIKDTDPRDPRILAPSYRNGWSIKTNDLKKELIEQLVSNGARYLAIITDEKPIPIMTAYLNKYRMKEFSILKDNWKLYLYTFTLEPPNGL